MCDWGDPYQGVPYAIERQGHHVIVQIIKTVPGMVNFRAANTGDHLDVADGTGHCLIADGYAVEAVRETADKSAETATAARPARGRPKK